MPNLDIIYSGEKVVENLLLAIKELNKSLVKNPNNINNAKRLYEKRLAIIAKDFSKESKIWIEDSISNSYLEGLHNADNNLIGYSTAENKIVNGSFLINNTNPTVAVPEIPGQTILAFKGFENHIEFFSVFRAAAYYSLENKPFQIMRIGNDIFRQVAITVGELTYKESDIFTRRMMSQKLLNEYAKKGIQAINYKNGRRVSIDNYCEMLARTITMRTELQAGINRYVEKGYNLGIVSAHFRACDLCTPYEGVTLSLDGLDKRYESIWDAELQGLFHSNCKHDVSPFFENVTNPVEARLDKDEKELVNKYGYKEAQKIAYNAQIKQRYIERQIREYKRRSLIALDQNTKNAADLKVKYWQEKQREHLKANTYLPRKYSREQIKTAH